VRRAALVLALLAAGGWARGEDGAQPALAEGARLFDEAVRYVAGGAAAVPEVRSFVASMEARIDLPPHRHQGDLRIAFEGDRLRLDTTVANGVTTKILNGERAWVIDASRRVSPQHGRPGGDDAIRQMKEDRARFEDIGRFLTLRGLKGSGATFRLVGPAEETGDLAGRWLKVERLASGRSTMTFWLAYATDAEGRHHATWPGAVRVEGTGDAPAETYVLREWTAPAPAPGTVRYPRLVRGFQATKDGGSSPFLVARLRDLRVNEALDPAQFEPPR
jgi:hypothetical protein